MLKINPMTIRDTFGQRRDNQRLNIKITSKNNKLTSTAQPSFSQYRGKQTLLLWQLLLCVLSCQIAGLLLPHFAVCAEFALTSWDAVVERARIHSPLWPACWLDCPDRSRSSPTSVVRDIWDVYIREVGFVPLEVRTNLFRLCNSSDVDSSWLLWSREAEASLSRAYWERRAGYDLQDRVISVYEPG